MPLRNKELAVGARAGGERQRDRSTPGAGQGGRAKRKPHTECQGIWVESGGLVEGLSQQTGKQPYTIQISLCLYYYTPRAIPPKPWSIYCESLCGTQSPDLNR